MDKWLHRRIFGNEEMVTYYITSNVNWCATNFVQKYYSAILHCTINATIFPKLVYKTDRMYNDVYHAISITICSRPVYRTSDRCILVYSRYCTRTTVHYCTVQLE